MKNIFYYWLAFFTGIIILAGCKKDEIKTTDGKAVTLYNCAAKTIEPYICFDSLITDSRCPRGAECIWQGTALIKVSFHEKGNIHKFKMSLEGFPGLGYPSDTTIDGYHIIFTDLKPHPDINSPGLPTAEVQAFFNITY